MEYIFFSYKLYVDAVLGIAFITANNVRGENSSYMGVCSSQNKKFKLTSLMLQRQHS